MATEANRIYGTAIPIGTLAPGTFAKVASVAAGLLAGGIAMKVGAPALAVNGVAATTTAVLLVDAFARFDDAPGAAVPEASSEATSTEANSEAESLLAHARAKTQQPGPRPMPAVLPYAYGVALGTSFAGIATTLATGRRSPAAVVGVAGAVAGATVGVYLSRMD